MHVAIGHRRRLGATAPMMARNAGLAATDHDGMVPETTTVASCRRGRSREAAMHARTLALTVSALVLTPLPVLAWDAPADSVVIVDRFHKLKSIYENTKTLPLQSAIPLNSSRPYNNDAGCLRHNEDYVTVLPGFIEIKLSEQSTDDKFFAEGEFDDVVVKVNGRRYHYESTDRAYYHESSSVKLVERNGERRLLEKLHFVNGENIYCFYIIEQLGQAAGKAE